MGEAAAAAAGKDPARRHRLVRRRPASRSSQRDWAAGRDSRYARACRWPGPARTSWQPVAKPGPARCVARLRRLAFAPTWVQRATACELVSPRLGFGGRQPEPLWFQVGNVTSKASFACSGCRSWCKIILRQCRTRPRESRGGDSGAGICTAGRFGLGESSRRKFPCTACRIRSAPGGRRLYRVHQQGHKPSHAVSAVGRCFAA